MFVAAREKRMKDFQALLMPAGVNNFLMGASYYPGLRCIWGCYVHV